MHPVISDDQKLKQLAEILKMNNEAVSLFYGYLTQCPTFITKELLVGICSECGISEENAFSHLLLAACGLDIENNAHDRELANTYIIPAIHKLDPEVYRANPFYRQIHIPEIQSGNWLLRYEKYMSYEAFVCNEIHIDENFKEIPQIGFFDTEFTYPVLLQNSIEWMAIKPNEIESMQEAIHTVTGEIAVFGLGLGYYAYMVSEKETVGNITIIENNSELISLFKTHILPQFPNKHKISIIQADAFEYAEFQMPGQNYNYAFIDLWHDVSDGYVLYLKMKKLESLSPSITFIYWIEKSLLSHLRWNIFHGLHENSLSDNKEKGVPSKPVF